MAVAKIIFKLGAKRLSAAQKRALAKAIKASALKRARKANFRTAGLKMKRARFAVKYGKTVNRLQSAKVKGLRDVNVSRVKLTKRLQTYDALNHPSRLKKSLGLFNEKKAAAAFKKADREYVRSMIQVGKSSKKVASLQNKLNKLDNKDLKLMKSIDKSIRSSQTAVKEAEKYAKISGTKINKAVDLSYRRAQSDAMSRAFNYTFYGAIAGTTGLKVAAIQKQKAADKKKKT